MSLSIYFVSQFEHRYRTTSHISFFFYKLKVQVMEKFENTAHDI